jgi:site-specific recombinase XerD
MATINFLYRSTKDKSNLHLRLLYRINKADYVYGVNTKYEVSKEYWSKYHKQTRPKDISISNKQTDVNTELNKIENHILTAFNSVNPIEVNKEWLQNQIDNYYNPTQEKSIPNDLISYIDYYIEYRKNEIKETSVKKYNVIKHKLERFQKSRKKVILIKEVNDNFKNEFVNYLKAEKYSQNTMQRELVFIKTFCKHARFLGLETSHQLDGLRLDRAKAEKIYLTFEDLELIEKIDKSKLTESLDNAKDWLIISCYTGQRISDFMRFSKEQIRIEDGKQLLEFTQQKTGKIMTIPVHPKVKEILNKRNGEFPYMISDQKYNDYIKTVCELAEINQMVQGSKIMETAPKSGVFRKESKMYKKYELVTSHIGRRSFATNFYGKIPTTYLINVTGHSTETMFLSYIGKSNKDLALEIANYF